MAARKKREIHHDDLTRRKIKQSMLINRLTNHAMGKLTKPMEPSQVQAALGLLKKCLPDLASIEHTGQVTITHEEMLDQLK